MNLRNFVKDVISSFEMILKRTLFALKLVFSNFIYIAILIAVFVFFWIVFNVLEQTLFFFPVITFYLPEDAIIGFILNNITSVLMAVVIALDIYIISNSSNKLDKLTLSSSILSIASSTCASCSSVGFFIISVLGVSGIIITDFLTNYQIPLKIVSIGLVCWTLITVTNKITKACKVVRKN